MNEFKEIKASCHCCYAGKDKIVYQNSGKTFKIIEDIIGVIMAGNSQ